MIMKHLGLIRGLIYLAFGLLGMVYQLEPMPVFPIMILSGLAEMYCYKKEISK